MKDDSSAVVERGDDEMSGRPLGKREQTKRNNQEAILEAAREVFGELGYGATTVRDIIRKTGLASGTFYNYYKSKEEVFQALMDESTLRFQPRLRAERIRSRNFADFVRNGLRAYFEYLAEDQAHYRVWRRNTGALRVRMDTPTTIGGFEEIRHYIEEDMDAGLIPRIDSEYLMAAIVGVAQEIGDRMVLREKVDPAEAADFAAAIILKGIDALPAID